MAKNYGTPSKNRLKNERLILEFLGANGPTPREKICEYIGVPYPTLSRTIERLRHKGLILEEKGNSGTRGPKPVVVRINTESGFVGGALFSPDSISVGLFAINLDTIGVVETSLNGDCSPQNVSQTLQKTLFGLLDKHHIPKSKLLSMGISLPGMISQDGIVKTSSPLKWQDVPFKKIISEYLTCHICFSKMMFKKGYISYLQLVTDMNNRVIFYVYLGQGLGGLLSSDGRINFGSSGFFSEIGHVVVEPNGPICGCGNKGCIESLISGPAIAERIRNDIKNGEKTILSTLIKRSNTIKEIIDLWGTAIQKGDPYALKLRSFVGEYLGRLVAMGVNFYDPDLIILGGYVSKQCSAYFIEKIKEKISAEACVAQLRDIRIIPAEQEEEIVFVKNAARDALWDLKQH